jgi:hypothetical protein
MFARWTQVETPHCVRLRPVVEQLESRLTPAANGPAGAVVTPPAPAPATHVAPALPPSADNHTQEILAILEARREHADMVVAPISITVSPISVPPPPPPVTSNAAQAAGITLDHTIIALPVEPAAEPVVAAGGNEPMSRVDPAHAAPAEAATHVQIFVSAVALPPASEPVVASIAELRSKAVPASEPTVVAETRPWSVAMPESVSVRHARSTLGSLAGVAGLATLRTAKRHATRAKTRLRVPSK